QTHDGEYGAAIGSAEGVQQRGDSDADTQQTVAPRYGLQIQAVPGRQHLLRGHARTRRTRSHQLHLPRHLCGHERRHGLGLATTGLLVTGALIRTVLGVPAGREVPSERYLVRRLDGGQACSRASVGDWWCWL